MNQQLKLTILGYKVAVVKHRFELPPEGKEDEEFFFEEKGWEGYLYRCNPEVDHDPNDFKARFTVVDENNPSIIIYDKYEDAVAEVDRLHALSQQRVHHPDGSLRLPPELHQGLRIEENFETYEDFRYKFIIIPMVKVHHMHEKQFTHTYERWKPEDPDALEE